MIILKMKIFMGGPIRLFFQKSKFFFAWKEQLDIGHKKIEYLIRQRTEFFIQ